MSPCGLAYLAASFVPASSAVYKSIVWSAIDSQANFSSTPPASRLPEGPRLFWVREQRSNGRGQVLRELLAVDGEGGDGVGLEVDQVARDSLDNHLQDASGGRGDDRGAAGHGFKVDDAEWLIN